MCGIEDWRKKVIGKTSNVKWFDFMKVDDAVSNERFGMMTVMFFKSTFTYQSEKILVDGWFPKVGKCFLDVWRLKIDWLGVSKNLDVYLKFSLRGNVKM